MSKPVAIISGASGGIGLATASLFLAKGYTVYGLSRSPYDSGEVQHIVTDVSQKESVDSAIKAIIEKEARIDVMICNAGFGISGSIEHTKIEDAKQQFEVTFFGALLCAQAVLEQMRRQKSGCILFISSVAGLISIPFQSFYSASKAAVISLAAALANEARPYGVRVSALLPGDIKTGFTAARKKDFSGLDAYPALKGSIETMERDEQSGMEPSAIAAVLYRMANKGRLKPQYTAGLKYKLFLFLIKILPSSLINRIVCMLYAK